MKASNGFPLKKVSVACLLLMSISGIAFSNEEEDHGSVVSPSHEGTKARAMMGVATAEVAPSLRDYLDINPGFGIQVYEVVEATPAFEAGIERNDILVQLDDQLLISPEHLALLIGTKSPGDTVTVHLIRRGVKEKVEVELGTLDPNLVPAGLPSNRPSARGDLSQRNPAWQDEMRRQQELWQEWIRKKGGKIPSDPEAGAASRGAEGSSPGVASKEGFPVHVFGKEGVVTIDNPKGSVTLETEGGETKITIRDAEREVIHEGPFDSEEGVSGLPASAQDSLKEMNLENLSRLNLPTHPKQKISVPRPQLPGPRIL